MNIKEIDVKSFITIATLIFLISCNSSDLSNNQTNHSPLEGDQMVEEVYLLINQHRQARGLREVILDHSINEIALTHATDMSTQKIAFGHSGFNARCIQAREALGGGNLCLENVAKGQNTPQEVFRSWVNSSGHRENIESTRVTHMGLGYAKDKNGTYYWSQFFLEKN